MARNKVWIVILFAVAVYIIMGIFADFDKLATTITFFKWRYFVLMIILTIIGYLVRYVKWCMLLNTTGVHLTHKDNLFVFFSGFSMVVTPGKVGEVWKSWIIKEISGDEVSKTLPVIIADRITDLLSLVVLSIIGIFYYKAGLSVLIVVVVCFIIFYIAVRSKKVINIVKSLIENKFDKYANDITTMHISLNKLMEPKTLIPISFLSAIAWFFECAGLYYIAIGFGQSISISLSTFIFSFSSLIGGISMIPGGLGVAEASISGLLMTNDISSTFAIGIAIMLRLGSFWFGAVLGFVVYITMKSSIMEHKMVKDV